MDMKIIRVIAILLRLMKGWEKVPFNTPLQPEWAGEKRMTVFYFLFFGFLVIVPLSGFVV